MTSWRSDMIAGLWEAELLRSILECGKDELEEIKRFMRLAWRFAVDHEAV